MTDEGLVRLLRKDPDRGMEILIDRYAGIVSAVVKGRLCGFPHGSADIEECTAETFEKFYFSLDGYDPSGASVRTYLCVIARNVAANLTRRLHPVTPIDPGETGFDIPDDSLSEMLEERETLAEVFAEVRKLGEPDAGILMRKYYVGQTSKEIAEDLGMTVSNVDTRAHRAIGKLKSIFGGKGK